MQRSLGYLVCGLAGILLGYLLGRGAASSGPGKTVHSSSHSAEQVAAAEATRASSAEAARRILLGNIAAVPFQELYGLLAEQKPEEIAQLAAQLRALPEGRDKEQRIAAFFKAWAHLDPTAALAAAVEFKSPEAREMALWSTIEGADANAAAALAGSIERLPNEVLSAMQKSTVLSAAIGKWAQVDAPAAAEFLGRSPAAGIGFTPVYNQVAQSWAASDPAAALNWAYEHRMGLSGMSALSGAMSGWWQKDPAAAQAYAAAHVTGPEGQQFISAITSEMTRQDPHKAIDWANNLSTPEAREKSYGMIAIQWAMNDPEAAVSWAASLPNDMVPMTLGSSLSFWAQTDPAAAGEWLQSVSGPARDEAARTYSTPVAERDPEAAGAWAMSIGDPGKRSSAVAQVYGQWKEQDAAAAQAWIEGSALTAEEKAKLLAPPKP